jgi:hypothetical protein
VADRPILFASPMVRALLAGTKTQTRRVFKWQGPKGFPHSFEHAIVDNPAGVQRLLVPYNHPDDANLEWGESGYHRHYGQYEPGDRLWVRESFFLADAYLAAKTFTGGSYKADATSPAELKYTGWRPSIHMPRWASRLTLTVVAVRVHRLHDMSDDDIRAEGITDTETSWLNAWHQLWAGINGEASWEANPWVAAYTFTVERRNIDAEGGA